MTSQQPGSELGGLTPNLRGMSAMDFFVLPSMPSERRHKPPQNPPPGAGGLRATVAPRGWAMGLIGGFHMPVQAMSEDFAEDSMVVLGRPSLEYLQALKPWGVY